MTAHTTAEVMASYLAAAAIPHVFCYPGDPIIEFLEAGRRRDIDFVLACREGTAAFMAEAYAMATGRPGVCLSTLGPGSTALVNGVACANLDRVPLLAISGQISTGREQVFTHQVVDHKLLFSPITKWSGRVEAASAATTIRKALRIATAERPGAVHLTCAGDVFAATAADDEVVLPALDTVASTVAVHLAPTARNPLATIAMARKPLLLAGIGATRSGATDALVQLAETAGMPVVVTPMAKGVFPEDHPYFAGVLDMACNQVVWDFLASGDLIVAAGFDPVELIKPWQLRTPVIHVDATANVDQVYPSECEVIGDVAAALQWFAADWSGEPRWAEADVKAHRDRLRAAYYAGRTADRLNPTDVVDIVRAMSPEDTVATCDVGSHKLLVGQGWQTNRQRSFLMTNGLSSMGFGLPAAITAKLLHPDRPVVALVGDGGFAMAATELRMAASRGLGLVVVVFCDGSLNRIELKQLSRSYPSTATRIDRTDLRLLAASMDCDGVQVGSTAELERTMGEARSLRRPLVIQADIDPSQYESQF